MRPDRGTSGFTLVELMTVVVIVGILLAVSMVAIRGSGHGFGPLRYASQVLSVVEEMRLRAVNTRRWQRLSVLNDASGIPMIVYEEAASTHGMVEPASSDWVEVRRLYPPRSVEIWAVDELPRAAAGTNPSQGEHIGEAGVSEFEFRPDGSAEGGTIFFDVRDKPGYQPCRLIMYAVTGMGFVYQGY